MHDRPASAAPALETRRFGAVAFADIVGYTVLMGAAPDVAHAAWMRLLHDSLRPLAVQHGSRFLKSTGDGVAAEFSSAGDALDWARGVHAAARDADRPDCPPIAFRIGIDQGEIIVTAEDIYGACVNVAARLQEHAPPGGIALSDAVRAALAADAQDSLQPIGTTRLRNIALPVDVFLDVPATPPRVPRRAPLLGTPSVAVMPFESLGADATESYFAEGIIADIVTSLAALRDLSVIARGATLGWGAGRHDPTVVGRMLGVRYMLSGTVRRGGGGLRLTALLRETNEGDTIWNDRYDIAEREVFACQDDIVARAVAGIAPSIRAAELRRALRQKPDSLTAYDHTLRAMHALDGLERGRFAEAEQHLAAAMREDPGYAMPAAWSAQWHSLAVGQAWSSDPVRDTQAVNAMAARAVALDPRNALGHAISGHYRAYHQRDPESALPCFDRALSVAPSHALSWTLRSASLSYLGRAQEALAAARRGFALSPQGADRYYFQFFVGLAEHGCGNHEAAVRSMRLSLRESPGFTSAHRILVAALGALGAQEEARAVAAEMMRFEPHFRLGRYAEERQPFVDPTLGRQLLDALRGAGVPD
jgi:adenylate cyclase